MIIIGLLGGIACGKSAVSKIFEDLNAKVFDADRVAHNLLKNPKIIQNIVNAFSSNIIDDMGQVSRKKLGELVFPHKEKLEQLNQIMHPQIFEELQQFLQHHQNKSQSLVVLDVPLLIETGLHQKCNYLVFIETPLIFRQQQAAKRGWSIDELRRRENQQISLQKKKEISQFVLSNDGSIADLQKEVYQLWKNILAQENSQNAPSFDLESQIKK